MKTQTCSFDTFCIRQCADVGRFVRLGRQPAYSRMALQHRKLTQILMLGDFKRLETRIPGALAMRMHIRFMPVLQRHLEIG